MGEWESGSVGERRFSPFLPFSHVEDSLGSRSDPFGIRPLITVISPSSMPSLRLEVFIRFG